MINVIPKIYKKYKICIICEGFEDYEYSEKLITLGVFHSNYDIKLDNAKSITSISSVYQYRYMNDSYDLILVFCDTDHAPYTEYNSIKQKINNLHDVFVTNDIIIFANPCTMQIILSYFDKVRLRNQSKTKNTNIIEKLTGVSNYKAKECQRKAIIKQINAYNYKHMKENLADISSLDTETPSTNILKFLDYLEHNQNKWITYIKNKLDTEN